MHQLVYPRPLPDDPQWAPTYYNPMHMNAYAPEQAPYQPQLPSDLRVGPQSRMSYPSGMSPIQAQYRQSPDRRQSQPRGGRHAPSESESEESSEEEEESESSEEDEEEDEVQIVKVVQRAAPSGAQKRTVSGGSRGSRGGRGGRARKSR